VRIAFATTAPEVLGEADADRPLHEEAFARAGIELDYCVWWDGEVEWGRYDLVVVRSPWDYVPRLDEYRDWLHTVDRLGTLRNPAPVIEWNIDKRYLSDLAAVGVPVIPTRIATSDDELAGLLASETGERVVKPVVSAGSADTGRFAAGDPGALALGRQVLAGGTPVMVQPAMASVATEGEVSTVVFDGALSHSVRRGPILALGGGFHGSGHDEEVVPEALDPDQERVVVAAIKAVTGIATDRLGADGPPLYARVDLVRGDDGRELVLEVELNEPSFFLPVEPGAADRFVRAVLRHVAA
jgi:glutathione synthase/RimK-type ligase-like ATP-grasp enzyme